MLLLETDRITLIFYPSKGISFFVPLLIVATTDRSCGKASSTNLAGSIKYEQNLHGNAKPWQLATIGSSCLVHRSPVLKQQHNLAVRSTSTDLFTTFDENVKDVSSHAVEEKVGVLLLNLGGPETLDDVQPFLFNLFADPVSLYTTWLCF